MVSGGRKPNFLPNFLEYPGHPRIAEFFVQGDLHLHAKTGRWFGAMPSASIRGRKAREWMKELNTPSTLGTTHPAAGCPAAYSAGIQLRISIR